MHKSIFFIYNYSELRFYHQTFLCVFCGLILCRIPHIFKQFQVFGLFSVLNGIEIKKPACYFPNITTICF